MWADKDEAHVPLDLEKSGHHAEAPKTDVEAMLAAERGA